MRSSYLVIGLGNFGSSVARTLARLGHDVLGVDINMERIRHLRDDLTETVCLDATNPDNLRQLGINNYQACIVGTGSDLEGSVLISLNLVELGARQIVAKALSGSQRTILEKVGVQRIIFPEREVGERLARSLVSPSILDHIDLSPDTSLEEIKMPAGFIGKSLRQLRMRQEYGANVVGIKRGDKVNTMPGPDDILQPNDTLIIIGTDEGLSRLRRATGTE